MADINTKCAEEVNEYVPNYAYRKYESINVYIGMYGVPLRQFAQSRVFSAFKDVIQNVFEKPGSGSTY